LIGGPGKDILDGGPGKDKLIDWSGKYDDWDWCENKAWHKTNTDPWTAWLGQFVGDLATADNSPNPNRDIQVKLSGGGDNKAITNKGCKR
jgi:hypothetical protein